jgi:hypothetical protein
MSDEGSADIQFEESVQRFPAFSGLFRVGGFVVPRNVLVRLN